MKEEKKTTYKCEHCGKTSTVKSKMQKHEKECGANAKARNEQFSEAREIRNKAKSISHLAELCSGFLTKHSGIKCTVKFNSYHSGFGPCRNSHSAPIGKKMNWQGSSDLPTHYIGWSGTCNIYIDGGYNEAVCRVFEAVTGVYTGTGGSRSHGLGWSCVLWADDFPLFGKKIYDLLEAQKDFRVYDDALDAINYDYDRKIDSLVQESEPVATLSNQISELQNRLEEAMDKARELVISENEKPEPDCKRITREEISELVSEIS